MNNKVIVAGSIITDMSVKVKNHPKVGETVIGNELKYSPGGKGANQAVSSARLGADVTMVGMVGRDLFGEMSIKFLKEQGITNFTYSTKTPTGIAVIGVSEETGDNSIIVILGSNNELTEKHIEPVLIKKGDVLVSQFEIRLETVKYFFEKGREYKTINILNPAPALMNPEVQEILNITDILIVNETELSVLSGHLISDISSDNDIREAINKIDYSGIIIVTLGKNGVYAITSDAEEVSVEGVKVNAIDTTGAGDCFVGAIAYKYSISKITNRESLLEAITFANYAAALSVTKEGSGKSTPYYKEVEEFIKLF